MPKKLLLALLLLSPCFLSAQSQPCNNYTCKMELARKALRAGNYKSALDLARGAESYDASKKGEVNAFIDEVFGAIEGKREEAERQRKRAEEEKLRADEATGLAKKTARAAENTATFMQVKEFDHTLAMRMMSYNLQRHPENKLTRNIFYKTVLDSQITFYARKFTGHTDSVFSVAFSPDGKKILAGGWDGTARIWNVENRKVEKIFTGHSSHIFSVAFSSDGKKILTGSNDNTAKLWDVESQKEEKTFAGHTGGVSATFSPDGRKVLTGSHDGTAKIWNIETQEIEATFTTPGSLYIVDIDFSPDGKKILAGGSSLAILWDVESQREVYTFTGHMAFVLSVAFSPDGNKVLTGSEDGTVNLWHIAGQIKFERTIQVWSMVTSIAFSPDGKYILTGNWGNNDNTAKLWDISGKEIQSFAGHRSAVSSVAFSPDGKKMLTGSYDFTINLWDLSDLKTEKTLHDGYRPITAVALNSDSKKALLRDDYGKLMLWDLERSHLIKSCFRQNFSSVYNLFFLENETKIVYSTIDETSTLWDVECQKPEKTYTGNVTEVPPDILPSLILNIQESELNQLLLEKRSIANDTIVTFDPETFEKIISIRRELCLLRFSPDRGKVAFIDKDGTAKIWNIKNKTTERSFTVHTDKVTDVVFSPDGRKLLTASQDKTARIWDVKTGRVEKTFVGHTGAVNAVAFSLDGKKILTGGEDGAAKFWDINSDCIECNAYDYSLSELRAAGLQLEPEDLLSLWEEGEQLNTEELRLIGKKQNKSKN